MKKLTYKGNCADYDSSQVLGVRGRNYRIVGASYDSETDTTTMELAEFHGMIFGSQGTVREV